MQFITKTFLPSPINLRQLTIFIVLTLVVYARYITSQTVFPQDSQVRINTHVRSEPIQYDKSQRVVVNGLTVFIPLHPEVTYGDRVIIEGTVKDKTLKSPKLIAIEKRTGLFVLRERIISFYQKTLPEPHASLVAGMTFGSKGSLPKDFWESLKASGTAHVVVASGMNVTLVAGFFVSALVSLMNRKKAVPIALAGIWLYTLLAGFDAPLVRAAIMGSLSLVAQEFGKIYSAWRALFLSALGMLIIWPEWVSDVGFLLSFCATAGLLAFQKPLAKFFKKLPTIIKEDLTTTVAAQIGVAPILYIVFGNINLLSPFINVLVLWTVVPITILGMLGGLVGLLVKPLGQAILLITYPLTGWFIGVVSFF